MTIVLAPRHEGAKIVAKNGDTEELVFASNQTAQSFSMEDSNIESRLIKPIYMWALVCAVDPHPDAPDIELRPLRHTLRRWLTKDRGSRGQEVIYSPLKSDYKQWDNVSKRRIILEDRYRVDHLQDLSLEIPFEIFFASVSKKVGYGPVTETNQPMKREAYIFGLGGHQITKPHISVDEKDLAPPTDLGYTASHPPFFVSYR